MPKRPIKALRGDHSDDKGCPDLSDIDSALVFLRGAYASHLTICSLLENIADSLPDPPHEYVSQTLISMLQGSWAQQILVEEEKLFSFIERENETNIFVVNFLNRLRVDCLSDNDHTSELVATLETILEMENIREPESFGYMLRGFFESKRRQVGLKKSVMLPLAEQALNGDLQ